MLSEEDFARIRRHMKTLLANGITDTDGLVEKSWDRFLEEKRPNPNKALVEFLEPIHQDREYRKVFGNLLTNLLSEVRKRQDNPELSSKARHLIPRIKEKAKSGTGPMPDVVEKIDRIVNEGFDPTLETRLNSWFQENRERIRQIAEDVKKEHLPTKEDSELIWSFVLGGRSLDDLIAGIGKKLEFLSPDDKAALAYGLRKHVGEGEREEVVSSLLSRIGEVNEEKLKDAETLAEYLDMKTKEAERLHELVEKLQPGYWDAMDMEKRPSEHIRKELKRLLDSRIGPVPRSEFYLFGQSAPKLKKEVEEFIQLKAKDEGAEDWIPKFLAVATFRPFKSYEALWEDLHNFSRAHSYLLGLAKENKLAENEYNWAFREIMNMWRLGKPVNPRLAQILAEKAEESVKGINKVVVFPDETNLLEEMNRIMKKKSKMVGKKRSKGRKKRRKK